jgi:ferrous iron transport protein A
MNQPHSLNDLRPGQHAVVSALYSTGSMRRRLLDIGLIENTDVECLGRSPCGDPSAFLIRGAVIAIRSEDCENISVRVF